MPTHRDVSASRDFPADKEYGPGWRDVYDMAKAALVHDGHEPVILAQPKTDRDGRWGMRFVVARRSPDRLRVGVGVYGAYYPGNGAKTVAAALWTAFLQAENAPVGLGDSEKDAYEAVVRAE